MAEGCDAVGEWAVPHIPEKYVLPSQFREKLLLESFTTSFNFKAFYILPTEGSSTLHVALRTYNINRLAAVTETECLLRSTNQIFKVIQITFNS